MFTCDLKTLRTPEEREASELRAQETLRLMAACRPSKETKPKAVHGPLHQAIIVGDLKAVRAAITPKSVNEATIGGLTPLHLAVFGYSLAVDTAVGNAARVKGSKLDQELIVELLLEAGALIDVWDHEKRLPAACCDGRRMPESLKIAMVRRVEKTTRSGEPNERKLELNAFFSLQDVSPSRVVTYGMHC